MTLMLLQTVVPPVLNVPAPENKFEKFDVRSEEEVSDIIMGSSNASYQLDPILAWLLKLCGSELIPVKTKMINLSLQQGQVPDSWEAALIKPLLKKLGLELVYKNFRPVSNLPMVSKSAEKAVVGQFFRHCSDNAPLPVLPVHQSSFRQFHSTETALLKVQSDILSNMDKQEVTLLVLLDLSAAFDTVGHNILINILESDFGICGDVLKWFRSYLTGRVQRVIVNQQSSKTFNLNYGVPQGSCLGPVLFLLYASRLFEVVKKHLPSVRGYADDTQLYVSFRPDSFAAQDQAIKAIEICIADVRAWLVSHRLMFNDSKTEFIIIGSWQQLSKVTIASIKVGDCDIQPLKHVRNLGTWFDNHMSMNTHIGKVCIKAFRGLYNIRQIRKYLFAESAKCLIHAFVTSHLDYCNALLYKLPQYQYDRLQKVLNAAARVICLIPKFVHITPVLRELHLLPVKFRVEFKIALLVFKTLNGLAPQHLSELLVVKPRTRYSLRSDSETLLVISKVTRKTFGDRAFFHAGPTVWNALPSSLRNCRNNVPTVSKARWQSIPYCLEKGSTPKVFRVTLEITSNVSEFQTYLFKKAFNL